ncbi:MAG: tRNA (adenosine(37)-N6)-dimethylallyltransferase MiaA [Alphaproteobacteria bacterium]|nr:tRNA (adenosine(37)-N6)-dimethylallyltransferase MiaA [Alphaproteobacteria bacterium]MCW5742402.1 tRNA (adenosine(37)-N6)-dimethylallyltransferase MiaA [Alphaproteobacteria bacterium]
MNAQRQALILTGPTASGKSALGLEIAARARGVIINADAMQTYGAFPILTAQPTAAERAALPHALYGVLPLTETLSAQRWRELALAEMERAVGAGRMPILLGGTGLYLRALTRGLAQVPDVPSSIRDRANAEWRELGAAAFGARLARHDPQTAARLKPNDRQRHVRAWEVWLATERPLSEWQQAPLEGGPRGWHFRTVVLAPPRAALRAKIAARFDAMVAAGVVEEVRPVWRDVRAGRLPASLPGLKAHGAPELMRHLDGEIDLAEAVRVAVDHTRQYAKRQTTWLRHQIIADLIIDETSSDKISSILKF